MPRAHEKDSTEKFQIIILTFGMTGAGFALLTLVLVTFLNPGKVETLDALKKEYGELTKLLQTSEMRNLRAQAKLGEGQQNTLDIREIIQKALEARMLTANVFGQAKLTQEKGGLERKEQTIDLRPAKLLNILQFVGDVRDAKKTIQVHMVSLNRDRSAREEDDSWSANIRFVDYGQKAEATSGS